MYMETRIPTGGRQMDNLKERIDRLERQNRRLKLAGVFVVGVATAYLFIGMVAPNSKVLEGVTNVNYFFPPTTIRIPFFPRSHSYPNFDKEHTSAGIAGGAARSGALGGAQAERCGPGGGSPPEGWGSRGKALRRLWITCSHHVISPPSIRHLASSPFSPSSPPPSGSC